MKTLLHTLLIAITGLLLFTSPIGADQLGLDYPHNATNSINCWSCHYNTANPASWATHVPQDIDDTPWNNLCWSCHNDVDAQYMLTHSSLNAGDQYGEWTIECRTCHWVHHQSQYRTYGADSYVYTATTAAVTASTVTRSGGTAWTEDEYAGYIVVPNINQVSYNYMIVSNTADTLTVASPIDLSKVTAGVDTMAIIYGKLIRDEVETPNSGVKTVKFFNNTGPHSFADGDSTRDGVCEVCHTQTNHFRNDGNAPDQLHDNLGGKSGTDCIDCHTHPDGFGHGGGSAVCEECHGHDPGYGGATGGHGTYVSHSTHTENDADDLKGPNVGCSTCHDTNNFPNFADGATTLAATTVCDTCHSPGGTYDGVNDPVIGAKANWHSSIYQEDSVTLQTGKEKWCAGCHDKEPSVIQGVSAPNVIGDEDGVTNYGTGWGFYKTGHGLPADETYPASGGISKGAGRECGDCHDLSLAHIDGESRTYSAASDNYQAGYRLKYPMNIPRTGLSADDFGLCFTCHPSGPYVDQNNDDTNFRNSPSGVNGHWQHNMQARPVNDWDSDWDGTGDSHISCPSCHNVHGSPSPSMVRHGELISTPGTTDKVPALNLQYTPEGTYPTLADSTGGKLSRGAGVGSIAANGVCSMCHVNCPSYTRTPTNLYFHKIKYVNGRVGSNELTVIFSKGVYNATGAPASPDGDLDAGDFTLTDTNDDNHRTITGVTHTAGEAMATLTMSQPLTEADIDADTLAPFSAESIYDVYGNPIDTTPVTILSDGEPPTISNLDPADSAVDIVRNSSLSFTLSDNWMGIDWNTFAIHLVGNNGYDKTYTYDQTAMVSKSGTPEMYEVTVEPDALFGENEEITVTVNVDDLAGNSLVSPSWSFSTGTEVIEWFTPASVLESGCLGTPENLMDGDTSTGNSMGTCGAYHYAIFKLAATDKRYTVTDVRLYGGPDHTSDGWYLMVSSDGYTYTKIMQPHNWPVGGASQWYEYTLPNPALAENLKYIRVDDWHPGPEGANAAFEFQFKGTPVFISNNVPSLSWTGDTGYTTDGVDPDSADGGSEVTFMVSYTDTDGDYGEAPTLMQVWIDSDESGTYDSTEKHDMTEADSDDTNYKDGKLYTYTQSLMYTGDGNISYRFAASDGLDLATGDPILAGQVVQVTNNVPILAWTGETLFTPGGVYPDSATSGNSFEFRVSYSDVDNNAPSVIQVWVDLNDDGDFDDPGEKYDMTELDSGDTVITDGKLYTKTMALDYAGDGDLNYRFYATDGTDDAVGDPVSGGVVHVVSGTNIAPTLAWAGEAGYTADGVDPDVAIGGSDFVFKVSYADADNDAPTGGIQVWVDENDNGTYEADEKYDLGEADAGDTDYTDGKIYAATPLTLAHGSDRSLNYCFYASDGTDVATGAPVFDSTVTVLDDTLPAGTVGYWKFEEGSGNAALDETINLNNGTISGAARTAGISGEGLSFDGVNDYVQIPDADSLDLTSAGTIEVWAYKNSQKNYQMYVTKGRTQAYQLMDKGTTGQIAVRWGSASTNLATDEVVPTGGWHHIVATYDGNNLSLYIDGHLSKSVAYTTDAVANTTPVRIGARDDGYCFDGRIDEVVIYNRALTETEVRARYGARLKAATALDTSGGGAGIQTGDQMVMTFDGATDGAAIDAGNIDEALALDNSHTWLDGSGSIGSAAWSTTNYDNDTLTITLSTDSGVPTVSVGDTITLDGTIRDAGMARPILDSIRLTGSFDIDLPAAAVGFWRFDEGAGSIAYDDTSNSNDGSITGATWTGDGISGSGLSFDGSGDSVDVADDASLNITKELSIEMWIKPAVTYDSSLSDNVVLMDRHRSAGTDSYIFLINSDGRLHLGSSGGNIQSTRTSWTAGTWYHIVGTYRDNGGSYSGELYVNGVAEPLSVDNYDAMAGGSQVIGIGGSDEFENFNGDIDEVVIYKRALTATEVQERYAEGAGHLTSLTASDNSSGGPGIQAGDQVVIHFNVATNGPDINAGNIDTVLALNNGHSWLDGSGAIGSGAWSTTTDTNDTLTITLSDATGVPSVVEGDTITLDGATIKNSKQIAIIGSGSLGGTFGQP
jgi:hypothetical protein